MNMYTVSNSLFTKQMSKRKFPARKEFLFKQYAQMFQEKQVIVFLQHNNTGVEEMKQIRNDIAKVPTNGEPAAKLTVIKSAIARKVTRMTSSKVLRNLNNIFVGPIATLTFDEVSPAYISNVMAALDKTLGAGRPHPKPVAGQHSKEAKNVNTRILPLAAVIAHSDGSRALIDIPSLRDIGLLPTLDVLRSQIVGLLSSTPSQLAATLEQARGGQVALTLDARRRQLEE